MIFIATRYYENPVDEPYVMMGYPEREFNIAEAVVRGWINGDAFQNYYNGIRSSMEFYGISNDTVSNYLSGLYVKYNPSNALNQILTQKYIACFFNSGWVPFYNQRRTGIPTFDVGPGTLNNGEVPKRWQYPQGEYDNNNANVTSAVENQYPDGDDINGVMWLIQ
jgi:hypothetical protein